MNSDSRIETMHSLSNRFRPAKHTPSLILALLGVMAVAGQMFVPTARTSTAASVPGELNTPRSGHTATLLTNGKVLIVGGDGFSLPGISSGVTELFDPGTGTWSVTGTLQAARIGHTATLLTDGKVLVAAGFGIADVPVGSAELYDPATGKWSSTGNLLTARSGHTATLLPDGKVLVAGGGFDSAELYDPTTGTWSEAGTLNIPRFGHSATLLTNGKILVAGGFSNFNGTIDSAELYDPDTGTWSLTGTPTVTTRWGHTATLLQNSKVLVAGGFNDDDGSIDSAELYDPKTGTWSPTAGLNAHRSFHTATLLPDGRVLAAGGIGRYRFGWHTQSSELYDPATGTWSLTAGPNVPRSSHTATLLPDGRVLAAGGSRVESILLSSSTGTLNSSELYDPDTETWVGPPLPVITGTSRVGKTLLVFGENFEPGAVLLRNGFELRTKDSSETNPTSLVAKKKAGKTTKPGDRLQVLNRSSGALSKEFIFSGS